MLLTCAASFTHYCTTSGLSSLLQQYPFTIAKMSPSNCNKLNSYLQQSQLAIATISNALLQQSPLIITTLAFNFFNSLHFHKNPPLLCKISGAIFTVTPPPPTTVTAIICTAPKARRSDPPSLYYSNLSTLMSGFI